MTLLISLYTGSGIVFAADSQITAEAQPGGSTRRLDPQTKVLPVKRLGVAPTGGVVGYFGLAEMEGRPMDEWLRGRIQRFSGAPAVELFAHFLRDELCAAATSRERQLVSGFHIGGFEKRDGVAVPVFHFLRNTENFDAVTGVHSGFVDYWTEEHFPSLHMADVAPANLRACLRQRERQERFPFWYRNGDLRVAAQTWQGLQAAVAGLTAQPGWGPIEDLAGFEELPDERYQKAEMERLAEAVLVAIDPDVDLALEESET